MTALLDAVLAAATAAGAKILAVAARDLGVRQKSDESPVTAADLAAHDWLAARLPLILPGIPVVSEESGEPEAAVIATAMTSPRYWLVDPLDGTRDFIAGTGDFTVNVALMEGGVPVLGCIVAPARGRRFIGGRGIGAFEVSAAGERTPLTAAPAAEHPLTCLVSRFHQGGEVAALQARFPGIVALPMGSSLKYGVIARGEADFTIRRTPTKLWDTAAAQAIVEAAGGAMVTKIGAALSYRTGSLTNPGFVAYGARGEGSAASAREML